jgi:hypothetical protein
MATHGAFEFMTMRLQTLTVPARRELQCVSAASASGRFGSSRAASPARTGDRGWLWSVSGAPGRTVARMTGMRLRRSRPMTRRRPPAGLNRISTTAPAGLNRVGGAW